MITKFNIFEDEDYWQYELRDTFYTRLKNFVKEIAQFFNYTLYVPDPKLYRYSIVDKGGKNLFLVNNDKRFDTINIYCLNDDYGNPTSDDMLMLEFYIRDKIIETLEYTIFAGIDDEFYTETAGIRLSTSHITELNNIKFSIKEFKLYIEAKKYNL